MNGIHAAFTVRIGKDAEVCTARDGKPRASLPVAVDANADGEAPATWVRVALFGDAVGAVAPTSPTWGKEDLESVVFGSGRDGPRA